MYKYPVKTRGLNIYAKINFSYLILIVVTIYNRAWINFNEYYNHKHPY